MMEEDSRPMNNITNLHNSSQTSPSSTNGTERTVRFSVENEIDGHQSGEPEDHNVAFNLKSWRNMQTIEHPPIIDFYRNSVDEGGGITSRPSMKQLIHGENAQDTVIGIDEFKKDADDIIKGERETTAKLSKFEPPAPVARTKFGWIQGVFVRCILNIFGVMLYLRISWVAGQAGILLGCAVVLLASLVTFITALSTCAICTNGDVKGGGAYFLISRSLGPEFGGSIGLIFSVANAVGAAMYVVGFAETVRDLMKEYNFALIDGGMNDVRLIGLVSCCLLMAIVFIGTSFESKMQMGLLVILTLSIIDYFVGTLAPVSESQLYRGITGYSFITMSENMLPNFQSGENFFSVFAIYFPAATGIMAGANISGDLADPQNAIPKGTLLAIAVTTVIYLMVVFTTGATCVRYADGFKLPYIINNSYFIPDCAQNNTCPYGLMNYFQVMENESLYGPLITAGIFAATLSSALASLVSAPKIFQAVCKDRLFPKVDFFARGYGKDEEPRRAYVLGFVIALVMILIGELNAIAPIISNFFLASYALVNYSCFDASFADSPGFRPAFKYYNMWVSLSGALLCISVMFIVSWSTALLTFFFFAMLFLYILYRKPDVNWGSSTQAHTYKNALQAMQKLANTEEHVKNYRPQVLLLAGNPAARPSLVDFAYNITKGSSLMICGFVVPYEPCDRVFALLRKLDVQMNEWLRKRHVKSFYVSVASPSLRTGAQTLLQVAGLGKLKPNILITGFKRNWADRGVEGLSEINDYFGVIQDAFESRMGVAVLRNSRSGLDYSELMKRHNVGDTARLNLPEITRSSSSTKADSATINPVMQETKSTESSGTTIDKRAEDDSKQQMNVDHEQNGNASMRLHRQRAIDVGSGGKSDTAVTTANLDTFATANTTDALNVEHFDSINESLLLGNILHLAATGSYLANCPLECFDEERNETEMDVCAAENHSDDCEEVIGVTETPRRHSLYDSFRRSHRPTAAQRELVASICRFHRKIKGATIDVWWLYDDGGLTLLVPHLLTLPKSYLENARLRVFTVSTSPTLMEQEQRSMAALLTKFRIDFSDVSVIPDIGRKPNSQTIEAFTELIKPFICEDDNVRPGMITRSELEAQKHRTNRHLRCSELLHELSYKSDLIVLTLPVPRFGFVSSCLYMAWLDMMTRNLPPTLMIRGNQTSVLTFYS
ncbi:K-Cl cotransporter [Onchocerca flexuosa]|uniref:K-Cl cotransporter n=1 Tax=Onchocerca flexuosa TaxID=387005 RepID=A0A238C3P4_9BILA|nr:K-Cl cotransporter [Onchocerca flexuosa]